MRFKNIFFLIIFLSFTNAKSNELNLNDKYIPLKDFLILKFDLFFEENVKNIYNSAGLMVSYQLINQKIKIDNNDNIKITINAFMDKNRYSSKKYYPKLRDCNQIRNKLFVNKFGYTFFRQKLNSNLINNSNLYGSISENILNISNLNNEAKKEILDKTKIKINVFHPNTDKNISCFGNILDQELENFN